MANLLAIDLNQLPSSMDSSLSPADSDGWMAMPPDPADELHLRFDPKRGTSSPGKFCNGPPVRSHETKGQRHRILMNSDGHPEEWIMQVYLDFGARMQDADCVFPQLCLKEEHQNAIAYADQNMDGNGYRLNGTVWIAGAVDNKRYVILTTRGETGYMPQEWFWKGNG